MVIKNQEVKNAVMGFVHSIENLDCEKFMGYVSDNVTMFNTVFNDHLADSEEFREIWRNEFDRDLEVARKNGITGPPYIEPFKVEGLRVDFPSRGVAVATFHHYTWGQKNLRTIVFILEEGVWKIVHIHASSAK